MNTLFGPLSYGTAPLGNVYHSVSDEQAYDALEAAWEAGIRYFDTAPYYGLGLSERRLGAFLREMPRDEYILSTKVGRLLMPTLGSRGSDVPKTVTGVVGNVTSQFDTTETGIRRSLDESLERMGLDSVDVLYLHDPDVYDLHRGLDEGLPALAKLRDEGLSRAIGVGVNDPNAAAEAVRKGDLDVVLIAGRYTLLNQSAAKDLIPLCAERGIPLVAAAPFNSGLLSADQPDPHANYDYQVASQEVIERAQMIAAACTEFEISLPTAALRFAIRDSQVATVLVGMASAAEVRENMQRMSAAVPETFWTAIAERGLVFA